MSHTISSAKIPNNFKPPIFSCAFIAFFFLFKPISMIINPFEIVFIIFYQKKGHKKAPITNMLF